MSEEVFKTIKQQYIRYTSVNIQTNRQTKSKNDDGYHITNVFMFSFVGFLNVSF